jgi:hypothetical protein
MKKLRLLAVAALMVSVALPVTAQQKDPTVAANPRPPYLISLTELLTIVFEADESALKSLLPPGIKPAAGNVVGLNMYRAEQAVGLAPYTATYLWVNVDGFDSPDGTKGRWMAQGWYGPEPVPTVLKNQMGFPVQLGVTRLERDRNRVHAVLSSDGVDLLDATITLKEGNPIAASGILNYPALARNISAPAVQPAMSDIVVNRIPFTAESMPATPVSMDLHFRSTDAAKALQPKKLLDAFYTKGTAVAGFLDRSPPEMGSVGSSTAPAK